MSARTRNADEYSDLSYSFAWACRLADAERLAKQGNPARLKAWLSERAENERVVILEHLRNSRG